jgi:hypothetical protein
MRRIRRGVGASGGNIGCCRPPAPSSLAYHELMEAKRRFWGTPGRTSEPLGEVVGLRLGSGALRGFTTSGGSPAAGMQRRAQPRELVTGYEAIWIAEGK